MASIKFPASAAAKTTRSAISITFKRTRSTDIWRGQFDPQLYLETRYPPPKSVRNHFALFLLDCIHQYTTRLPSQANKIRVLEYGCGPVPIHTTSFAGKASEIVLAEFLECNRKEVKKWLTRDKSSFTWTPYIEYVVRTLEMHEEEEEPISAREEKLRNAIKAVVPCDIHCDPPIELEVKSGFDVVLSAFCIEAGTSKREEYADAVRKLSTLVKRGGSLLLFSGKWVGNDHRGYYTVGENTFYNVAVTTELVARSLEDCGGKELTMNELDVDPRAYGNIRSDMKGFIFASATIN